MSYKNPENTKKYQKKWREKNKEKTKRNYEQRSIDNYRWFLAFLGTDKLHCNRCHYDKCPSAIEIHHKNPKEKTSHTDGFASWRKLSLKQFQDKVLGTKIEILCANCHAEVHTAMKKNGK